MTATSVALEGFTHLIPFAAGHEIIRQGRRDLTLIRMTPDLIYDQIIGMGCARKLIFSWGGNPGVGSLHRLRDAVEHGWPQPLELEEHSHAAMASAYAAGAAGLPCAILRGYIGSDLVGKSTRTSSSSTVPSRASGSQPCPRSARTWRSFMRRRADRQATSSSRASSACRKRLRWRRRQTVVTVEEIVDDLRPPSPNSVVLPHWTIAAIVLAPGGARPSYAHGYYARDNAFYTAWDCHRA